MSAETSYDTLSCTWCGAERPENYHPPTWTLQGALGLDPLCPIKELVRQRMETAGMGGLVEETPKPIALPAPRTSYPRLTKHPPIVSQRGTDDGRRLQEHWQAVMSGCAVQDEGETETDQFADEDTDIVERSGVVEMTMHLTDNFEWNPVRRFLNT